MYSRKVTIAVREGLHSRPAAAFVRAANQTGLPITLAKDGMSPVDGCSLLDVMSADFAFGTVVEISVAGKNGNLAAAQGAIDALATLLQSDLAPPP